MRTLIILIAAMGISTFAQSAKLRAVPASNRTSFKADTTIDPKKSPGPINLKKHPEVMRKVIADVKSGKIAYVAKSSYPDTTVDLSKHPELVKAIIKDPSKWATVLKVSRANDTSTVQGKNKQVIRDIIAVLINEGIVKERSEITSFLLSNDAFMLNGKKLSQSLHADLKAKYIKAPDYVVYYGNSEMKGNGIFQRADNL